MLAFSNIAVSRSLLDPDGWKRRHRSHRARHGRNDCTDYMIGTESTSRYRPAPAPSTPPEFLNLALSLLPLDRRLEADLQLQAGFRRKTGQHLGVEIHPFLRGHRPCQRIIRSPGGGGGGGGSSLVVIRTSARASCPAASAGTGADRRSARP